MKPSEHDARLGLAQRVDVRRQRDPYAAYERMKRELPKDLTPEQYTAACRALARKAGI